MAVVQLRPVTSPAAREGGESPVGSTLLVLASFAGGLANLFLVLEQRPAGVWRFLDVAVGALACIALVFRRRAAVPLALALAAVGAFFATAGVANYVALFAVARRKRLDVAFLVALADIAAGIVFWALYPANASVSLTVMVNTAIALAVIAWGALQQTQQDLVEVYRDRAARIERERALRAEQIQLAERARISRDMHDSVAHYISLIALYAGGLEVTAERDAAQVAPTARTIRSTAIRALDELRTVIGVLRDGSPDGSSQERPARRVGGLIEAARDAGQLVVAHLDDDLAEVESPALDDVYRIVQEGLTNARKHAPGALVTVDVRRSGKEVLVSVTNPVDGSAPSAPGSRAGLVGLAERAAAAGGAVDHQLVGRGEHAEFRLRGRLPYR